MGAFGHNSDTRCSANENDDLSSINYFKSKGKFFCSPKSSNYFNSYVHYSYTIQNALRNEVETNVEAVSLNVSGDGMSLCRRPALIRFCFELGFGES